MHHMGKQEFRFFQARPSVSLLCTSKGTVRLKLVFLLELVGNLDSLTFGRMSLNFRTVSRHLKRVKCLSWNQQQDRDLVKLQIFLPVLFRCQLLPARWLSQDLTFSQQWTIPPWHFPSGDLFPWKWSFDYLVATETRRDRTFQKRHSKLVTPDRTFAQFRVGTTYPTGNIQLHQNGLFSLLNRTEEFMLSVLPTRSSMQGVHLLLLGQICLLVIHSLSTITLELKRLLGALNEQANPLPAINVDFTPDHAHEYWNRKRTHL